MKKYAKNIFCYCLMLLALSTTAYSQYPTFDPPNAIFRISNPTATGVKKTKNLLIRFTVMNFSIKEASFQLFPAETEVSDERSQFYYPSQILLGKKLFKKNQPAIILLLPGDSISCQMLFPNFRSSSKQVFELKIRNRVIMDPIFDQESILRINNLFVQWL